MKSIVVRLSLHPLQRMKPFRVSLLIRRMLQNAQISGSATMSAFTSPARPLRRRQHPLARRRKCRASSRTASPSTSSSPGTAAGPFTPLLASRLISSSRGIRPSTRAAAICGWAITSVQVFEPGEVQVDGGFILFTEGTTKQIAASCHHVMIGSQGTTSIH